jgi:hypothetical protein
MKPSTKILSSTIVAMTILCMAVPQAGLASPISPRSLANGAEKSIAVASSQGERCAQGMESAPLTKRQALMLASLDGLDGRAFGQDDDGTKALAIIGGVALVVGLIGAAVILM